MGKQSSHPFGAFGRWRKQTATAAAAGGNSVPVPVAPADIERYAQALEYAAEGLRSWAAGFAPDAPAMERIRASERCAAIMTRHAHESQAFARRMSAESLRDAVNVALGK